jgi:DNA polymerase-3 subunit delta
MRSTGDILRAVQAGNIEPVYFLLGEEYYLQHLIIEQISKALFDQTKQDKTLLLPDELSNREIIDQLTQADLFASKKLFILRNPAALRNKYREELLDYCRKPLQNHNLIIIEDDYSDRKAMTKDLKKNLDTISVQIPFANELKKWARFLFKEKQLLASDNVVDVLIEIAGDSIYHIANEVEKISLNVFDDVPLTLDKIYQFSGWQRDYQRWEFLQAIGLRDLGKALLLGQSLFRQGQTMLGLMYPLTSLFQELLFEKLSSGTLSPKKGYIPLPPSVVKKLPQIAKRFSKEEIEYALLLLGNIDQRLKTTNEPDESLLSQFLFTVLTAHG